MDKFFSLFISHTSHYKILATTLKRSLIDYGIECFVAHEDIQPTTEWQKKIISSIPSSDALIALLTDDFYQSEWTNQEIGIAVGREVPIFTIRCGSDPQGFVKDIQAYSPSIDGLQINPANWHKTELWAFSINVLELILTHGKTRDSIINAFITRIESATTFNQVNYPMKYISNLDTLEECHINRLEKAYQNNRLISKAYNTEERLPQLIKKWKNAI